LDKRIAAPSDQAKTLQLRLHEILTQRSIEPIKREELTERIAAHVLANARGVDQPNFDRIANSDLSRMLDAYDELFFDHTCLKLANLFGMSSRLSSRMTSAGGKTTRTVYPGRFGKPAKTSYEIALSTSLLFQTFRGDQRSVRVCGLQCSTRLQAMQRIVEHELIHLSEMLVWVDSDCAKSRFQNITKRLFGHTEHRHELITQRERAKSEFNIRLGDRVSFRIDAKQKIGIVNRITRRATVLVESDAGELFTDGKRYERYYVPLTALTKSGRRE
jgi:AraC-like DNA-binding protein